MFTTIQTIAAVLVGRLNLKSERGATAVEYGIMVSLIAIVIIAAVTIIGTNLDLVFDKVGAAIKP